MRLTLARSAEIDVFAVTVLGGVDPYFRGTAETATQTHGPALTQLEVLNQSGSNMTPLQFAWRIFTLNFAKSPLETLGWFTVGKVQYLAFGAMPASATEGAVDAILVSSTSGLGFAGAVLSVRWRDLAPTAVMLVVWLIQNALVVPDQRYWFDVLPFLATLAGALVAAAWGRAPIQRRAAA